MSWESTNVTVNLSHQVHHLLMKNQIMEKDQDVMKPPLKNVIINHLLTATEAPTGTEVEVLKQKDDVTKKRKKLMMTASVKKLGSIEAENRKSL